MTACGHKRSFLKNAVRRSLNQQWLILYNNSLCSTSDTTPVKENGTSSPVPKSATPVLPGDDLFPLNMSNTPNSLSPVSRDESKGHPERKRKFSDDDSLEVFYPYPFWQDSKLLLRYSYKMYSIYYHINTKTLINRISPCDNYTVYQTINTGSKATIALQIINSLHPVIARKKTLTLPFFEPL